MAHLHELMRKGSQDMMQWGLDVIFTGKIKGVAKRLDPHLRIAVWKELMQYSASKQATIKHVIDPGDGQLTFSWDDEHIDETDIPAITIEGEIIN